MAGTGHRDGRTSPKETKKSPLDVKGVNLGVTREEIIDLTHEGRRGSH
jgi:hypothetical protein